MARLIQLVLLLAACLSLVGFSMQSAIVPPEEILSGGPPKDGIPAILEPKFIRPENANFLAPGDQVIGVRLNGEARAYPIKILTWHEIVNDTIGSQPLVVTY